MVLPTRCKWLATHAFQYVSCAADTYVAQCAHHPVLLVGLYRALTSSLQLLHRVSQQIVHHHLRHSNEQHVVSGHCWSFRCLLHWLSVNTASHFPHFWCMFHFAVVLLPAPTFRPLHSLWIFSCFWHKQVSLCLLVTWTVQCALWCVDVTYQITLDVYSAQNFSCRFCIESHSSRFVSSLYIWWQSAFYPRYWPVFSFKKTKCFAEVLTKLFSLLDESLVHVNYHYQHTCEVFSQ